MVQTEAERQFYLGVAGVRLWYARSPLPGAAPSPEFQFPEEVSVSDEAPNQVPPEAGEKDRPAIARSPSGQGRAPSRAVNLQALMDSPAPESPSVVSTPPAVGAETESEPESGGSMGESRLASADPGAMPFQQKLNLRLWLGRRFVLVSDLSSEASLRLQETLATNILASIGDQGAAPFGPVLWPVFNNPRLPGSRVSELIGVVRDVLGSLEEQQVILLGVPAHGPEATGEHWFVRALGRQPEVIFPHTLAELAGDPELKKQLWQLLRPLA